MLSKIFRSVPSLANLTAVKEVWGEVDGDLYRNLDNGKTPAFMGKSIQRMLYYSENIHSEMQFGITKLLLKCLSLKWWTKGVTIID